jgi:hypothetical protein
MPFDAPQSTVANDVANGNKLEAALARALDAATTAGRLDLVDRIMRQLEERRSSRP